MRKGFDGVRSWKAFNISFWCCLCMRGTWAEYETCMFLGPSSWWEVWSRAQKCTCLQTGTRVRALRTLRTWSADETCSRTEDLEATDIMHRLKPLIRLRARSWEPSGNSLQARRNGGGESGAVFFLSEERTSQQSPLSSPWCLNEILQVKAHRQSDGWAAALGKWTRFSSSCLFQKTSLNFILSSMLLKPSFLKHTTSLYQASCWCLWNGYFNACGDVKSFISESLGDIF